MKLPRSSLLWCVLIVCLTPVSSTHLPENHGYTLFLWDFRDFHVGDIHIHQTEIIVHCAAVAVCPVVFCFFHTAHGLTAVSYTHLDVYKRQARGYPDVV